MKIAATVAQLIECVAAAQLLRLAVNIDCCRYLQPSCATVDIFSHRNAILCFLLAQFLSSGRFRIFRRFLSVLERDLVCDYYKRIPNVQNERPTAEPVI